MFHTGRGGRELRGSVRAHWFSGSEWGQAQGWQSSGVPTVASPKNPGAHCSHSSPWVL